MDGLFLLLGGVLLYFGAEWFVGGASSLALALRVPQILVGLTIVAYGTSAPEVIVGIEAARSHHGDVALGNVLGSNIANIGLILGIAALVRPARVHGALCLRELPMLLLSTTMVPLVLLDGKVRSWEAGVLLLTALVYTLWMARAARTASVVSMAAADASATVEAADLAGAPKSMGRLRSALLVLLGLLLLLGGGNLFVRGAVSLAQLFGLSERLVGLTIVALGTSLPELVTSVIAAYRGHSDIAIGNVVGSNIFNVFLCLGSAALFGPVAASLPSLAFDLAALALMTGLCALFIRTERTISRLEGASVLGLYLIYTVITVLRG